MDKYDKACECVIVMTTLAQDNEINRMEKAGLDPTFFIRQIFNGSDELIPDADCLNCNGTGHPIPSGGRGDESQKGIEIESGTWCNKYKRWVDYELTRNICVNLHPKGCANCEHVGSMATINGKPIDNATSELIELDLDEKKEE